MKTLIRRSVKSALPVRTLTTGPGDETNRTRRGAGSPQWLSL